MDSQDWTRPGCPIGHLEKQKWTPEKAKLDRQIGQSPGVHFLKLDSEIGH